MEFHLEEVPASAVDQLDELLSELHAHESDVSPALGVAPARPDAEYLKLYRERFGAWLEDGDGFLVIARASGPGDGAGEPLGFVFAVEKQGDTAYDTGERIGYIEEIAVLSRARGSGIGQALIEESRRRFADRGVRFIKLSTVPGNDEARAFYARLGFSPAAQLLIGEV